MSTFNDPESLEHYFQQRQAADMGSTLEAAASVARFVQREWGDYGYRIWIAGTSTGGAIARVRHSDGSTFYVASDRFGTTVEVNPYKVE